MISPNRIKNVVLYTINSKCNDDCSFCIKKDYIKKNDADMTLNEIKKNYYYLADAKEVHHITISGGEPTIHPRILEIFEFFFKNKIRFNLVTNLLSVSSNKFLHKFSKYFINLKNFLICSINDCSVKSEKDKIRLVNLKKILSLKINVIISTTIHRNNYKDLPRIAKEIVAIQKNTPKIVELRMMYYDETPKEVRNKCMPKKINNINKYIEEFIEIFNKDDNKNSVILMRYPLCYLKNYNKLDKKSMRIRQDSIFLNVDKKIQFDSIVVNDKKEKFLNCKKCFYLNECSVNENYEYYETMKIVKTFCPIKE